MLQKNKVRIVTFCLLALIAVLGFWVRLYKIDNPVADWHSWRQADTAAVTRNFVKYGFDILYPKYDDFSDVSGKGMNPNGYRYVEFPIFNTLHFLLFNLSKPWLSLEIAGRLVSIFAAINGSLMIYFLAKRHISQSAGFVSALIYAILPFNIYFTRVILPDPLMVSLFLTTLNFYDIAKKHNKSIYWLLVALFGGLAVSVKPVAIFFLLPITLDMLKNYRLNLIKQPLFWLTHASFITPFIAWRLWSNLHPEGIPASTWLLNGNRIRFKPSFFEWIFGERIGEQILGKWGIWPVLVGLVNANFFVMSMTISSLAYLFTFATGNVQHDYYQTPIIPSIAILIGSAFHKIWTSPVRPILQRALFLICIGFMLYFSWRDAKGLYQVNNGSIVNAGKAVDLLLPKEARVIAPYQGDTAFLYQTNRRGFAWLYDPIKDLIDRFGITHYVSVTYDNRTRELMDKYTVVAETKEYVIIKLEERLNQ